MMTPQSPKCVFISFDYALKKLLRNKVNYDVLEGFLSELLKTNIFVKNIGESESNKEHPTNKSNKVDIFAENKTDEIILIELQFTTEFDYLHQTLFGTSKTVTEYRVPGDNYVNVKKVYSINIVHFDLGQGSDYIYHGKTRFTGLHKHDELHLAPAQHKLFGKEFAEDLDPEYYILKVNNFNDHTQDRLDEWIYYLKHNEIKDEFKAQGLDKARNVLNTSNLSPEDKKAYDYVLYLRNHERNAVASSKKEGSEEGREELEKLVQELEKEREELEKEREKLEKELEEREKEREELIQEHEKLVQEHEKLVQEREEHEKLLAKIAKLKRNK
ncbi:MAG: Rpn family recombination-promoting nuclease/putative transposase [Planctomycetaceae bacterium]|jgi:predicted transposase/invertase (TIGR01784 family)|nr:Rpn family recombination-promoting nuclease/putative transposase [Planctomycetaceae bacterium]